VAARRLVRRRAPVALLALGLVAGLACATARRPEPPPPAAFYWHVRAPGGGELFLLGSVHAGTGAELALPFEMALDWARAVELVVEVDPHRLPDLERLEAVQRHGLLPPDRTLEDVVSRATLRALVSYLRAHGYPLAAASRMRPWLLAQVVAQLEFAAAGYDPENGVDAWFLRRAALDGKPVAQLETLDEQLAAFGALPAPVEEALLRELLADVDAIVTSTQAILHAWETGDEARLLELLLGERDDPSLAAFHEAVFVARNHRMAERLAALVEQAPAPRFVVIGAGHLIGPQSIPALLAEAGFEVERRPHAFVRSLPFVPEPAPLPGPPPSGPTPAPAPAPAPDRFPPAPSPSEPSTPAPITPPG
jgi:uncharacterized protein YbaP (TraB family)